MLHVLNMMVSDAKMMADAAKKLTETKQREELVGIYKQIRAAAEKGEYTVSVRSLNDVCKTELQKNGFTVNYFAGDPRDYSDYASYTISWR